MYYSLCALLSEHHVSVRKYCHLVFSTDLYGTCVRPVAIVQCSYIVLLSWCSVVIVQWTRVRVTCGHWRTYGLSSVCVYLRQCAHFCTFILFPCGRVSIFADYVRYVLVPCLSSAVLSVCVIREGCSGRCRCVICLCCVIQCRFCYCCIGPSEVSFIWIVHFLYCMLLYVGGAASKYVLRFMLCPMYVWPATSVVRLFALSHLSLPVFVPLFLCICNFPTIKHDLLSSSVLYITCFFYPESVWIRMSFSLITEYITLPDQFNNIYKEMAGCEHWWRKGTVKKSKLNVYIYICIWVLTTCLVDTRWQTTQHISIKHIVHVCHELLFKMYLFIESCLSNAMI